MSAEQSTRFHPAHHKAPAAAELPADEQTMTFHVELKKKTVGQLITIAQVEGDSPSEIIEDAIVNLMDAYFEQIVKRAAA